MQIVLPPVENTSEGQPRRVGVELELAGLSLDDVGSLLVRQLEADGVHCDSERGSRYELTITGDPRGGWRVEIDSELLKTMATQAEERGDDPAPLAELAEELVDQAVRPLVPLEIVSPPLPMADLGVIAELTKALRAAGASGTGDKLAYAFGLHLNPELPGEDAVTVTAYLKAFLLLFEWLKARSEVDLTRRVLPYINSFADDYVQQVVAVDYWPELQSLMEDYLTANPTRNRPLDMLPLFSHLDAAHVAQHVEDERIQARPTLHYRLPNFDLNNERWSFARVWDTWLEVERLACDRKRLDRMSVAYAKLRAEEMLGWRGSWVEALSEELGAAP